MALSPVRQRIVDTCAELIGQNSGLSYHGLYYDAAERGAHRTRHKVIEGLADTAKYYGLKGLSSGELVYEANNRGDTRIDISVNVKAKPLLTEPDIRVLEALAGVLVPRRGHFSGYQNQVCSLLGTIKRQALANYTCALVQKFRAKNIEQAIVSAFATGILDQHKVFREEIPAPLAIIMNSDSYRAASLQTAPGIFMAALTSPEEAVAREFIRRLGSNGGLYSRGWYESVAAATGYTVDVVDKSMAALRRKLGARENGMAIYAASSLLGEPVIVQLPPKVEAQFGRLEVEVVRESAKRQLPIAGYRSGNATEVAEALHWQESTIKKRLRSVAEKTNTENSQQVITYFLAYGLISFTELRLDPAETPAVKAILLAASNGGRAAYLR